MTRAISAYVPCYNNASTVRRVVEGLLGQTVAPAEVLVVDDGSRDGSGGALADLPVRMIRHEHNLGRGAVRARAMREARHEIVISCDATIALASDFVERALAHLAGPTVAAVCGRIRQPPATNAIGRWRGRHLYKLDQPLSLRRDAVFITGGAAVRASMVKEVGGYDGALRHSEDAELGERLLAAGRQVIFDPTMSMLSLVPARLWPTLERYWRWYAGADEATTWRGYVRNIAYSVRGLAAADVRAGDVGSVPVSLFVPHYQFWKSRCRARQRNRTRT